MSWGSGEGVVQDPEAVPPHQARPPQPSPWPEDCLSQRAPQGQSKECRQNRSLGGAGALALSLLLSTLG